MRNGWYGVQEEVRVADLGQVAGVHDGKGARRVGQGQHEELAYHRLAPPGRPSTLNSRLGGAKPHCALLHRSETKALSAKGTRWAKASTSLEIWGDIRLISSFHRSRQQCWGW